MGNVSPTAALNYQSGSGTWARPGDTVNHYGEPLPGDVEFFREPPADLGPLVSAYSTLRSGTRVRSAATRLLIGGAFAAPIGVGVALLLSNSRRWRGDEVDWGLPLVLAALALGIVWYATRFKHVCSFVSARGMTRYRLKGSRDAVATEERFNFDDATELRTQQTRRFVNGVYSGTSYEFKWTDASGRLVYELKGSYSSKVGKPKIHDQFCYAFAGEIAWSDHLLGALNAQLDKYGFVIFNVGKGKAVRVGRGFFEFDWGGEVARITSAEIKTVNLRQGQFQIVHKDAGWFSRKGKFSFTYGSMANAKLFLLAMDRLLGLRFG